MSEYVLLISCSLDRPELLIVNVNYNPDRPVECRTVRDEQIFLSHFIHYFGECLMVLRLKTVIEWLVGLRSVTFGK